MSLFENAIASMEMGIEDYEDGSDQRLRSAVRSFYAGLLLLFKCKLQQMSPVGSNDSLLKQTIMPKLINGDVCFVGVGKKTVDFRTIKDRFKSLDIQVDFDALKLLNRIRNDIEHYFTHENKTVIQEALALSFAVSTSFASRYLREDLREHLSETAWDTLLEINQFVEAEQKLCEESRCHFGSESDYARENIADARCTECSSEMIYFEIDNAVKCRACGKKFETNEIATAIVAEAGSGAAYAHVKDGDEDTVATCPECGEYGFVVAEGRCVNCGNHCNTECDRCGSGIPADEITGSRFCGYCDYVMSKDD